MGKEEWSRKSAGGRKPDLYRLEGNSFYVMGIQLERSRIKMAIFDNHNKKVAQFEDLFQIETDNVLVDHIYAEATKLMKDSGINLDKLLGIGEYATVCIFGRR